MIRVFTLAQQVEMHTRLQIQLPEQKDIAVIAESTSMQTLDLRLFAAQADVVLLCFDANGLAVTGQVLKFCPSARVLAMSATSSLAEVRQLFGAGVLGYLNQEASTEELVFGLRTVAAGRSFLCTALGLAAYHAREAVECVPSAAKMAAEALSKRERQVLQLISEGLTNEEIATHLFTSRRTVETHRQNILDKTHARNTAALVRFAVRTGLVS